MKLLNLLCRVSRYATCGLREFVSARPCNNVLDLPAFGGQAVPNTSFSLGCVSAHMQLIVALGCSMATCLGGFGTATTWQSSCQQLQRSHIYKLVFCARSTGWESFHGVRLLGCQGAAAAWRNHQATFPAYICGLVIHELLNFGLEDSMAPGCSTATCMGGFGAAST